MPTTTTTTSMPTVFLLVKHIVKYGDYKLYSFVPQNGKRIKLKTRSTTLPLSNFKHRNTSQTGLIIVVLVIYRSLAMLFCLPLDVVLTLYKVVGYS